MRFPLTALAALLVLVVAPAAAQAATLVDQGPGVSIAPAQVAQWNQWVQRSLVPTVPGRVLMAPTECPGTKTSACADVWTPPAPVTRVTCTGDAGCVQETMAPEPAGADDTRGVIYIPFGEFDSYWTLYHELGHFYYDLVMDDAERSEFDHLLRFPHAKWPLTEYFAAGYALCARKRSLKRSVAWDYGYRVGPVTHQRVCALIRRAALTSTPQP